MYKLFYKYARHFVTCVHHSYYAIFYKFYVWNRLMIVLLEPKYVACL
jgi:hypothetical protein